MKKLLLVIVIVTFPLLTYFQYQNYRRFHPPVNYEYAASDSIDIHYYDAMLVEEYFFKVVELSAYARQKWSNEGVDVRFPDQNSLSELNISAYYNQILSRIKIIEAQLIFSTKLKNMGMSNDQVKSVEAGIPIRIVMLGDKKSELIDLKIGDIGEGVWLLQKQLVSKSDGHTIDGVFGKTTQEVLKAYQNSNNLFPSGTVNASTFDLLFAN